MKKLILSATFLVVLLPLRANNPKPYSVRMAESELRRNTTATHIDGMEGVRKWNYTTGLELLALLDVYDRYEDVNLFSYANRWADTMVNDRGEIFSYKQSNYNIDHICAGRAVLRLYEYTDSVKYRRAVRTLWEQLQSQPRTSDGGFWHKKIYPNQMWLDGLYMGEPFYVDYINRFVSRDERKSYYEDVINQFVTVAQHTYDASTGLYRHAWDETHTMFWADSLGQSAHAWGRALGWYVMALVDVLEMMPPQVKGREKLTDILQKIYAVLPKYADSATGMWYQVLDQPAREGNYLEATASAMFSYGLLKGVRLGVLPKEYRQWASDTYQNLIKTFVVENADGTVSLTKCCSVAGLGGEGTRRDGSFEYYISEPVRDNDPKGVGPFMWASLEYETMNNIDWDIHASENRTVAFPGAEGGGRYAVGGRGGRVLYVTKLTDDGSEGTLRWAVEQHGARTILFKVGGYIALKSRLTITNGDITIAGQSAPGDGITIRDNELYVMADNVIIRYLRFRMGSDAHNQDDALGGNWCSDVIIDHCSASWSIDECTSFYGVRNFTMQWCFITESLNNSAHVKGHHGYGGIWGGRNATFHHNLLAHHTSRNPRLDHNALYTPHRLMKYRGSVDYVNNVVYNWGYAACYGGEEGQWNVVNNYYKTGPATARNDRFMEVSAADNTSMEAGHYYVRGNVLVGNDAVTADNWQGITYKGGYKREDIEMLTPYTLRVPYQAGDPEMAYINVLQYGGASLVRDAVDKRIVNEVRTGTATYTGSVTGQPGIIDNPKDVGGYPRLKTGVAPKDTDGDGIPDSWERRNGLNYRDASDGNRVGSDGYTNLERYLNSLVK